MSAPTKLQDAACPEARQLPGEVWAKIFWFLSIEDWARAAGTSKASWAANPYPHSTCFITLTSACVPGGEGIITCSMLQHHPSIENNCEAFKFISRRCGAAMFALLDIDWELTPCKWGTMVQTAVFREDDKALSARLGQEHMIAIYDLLSDVAVDALAPDGMEAFLARAIAPDGANCKGTSAEPVLATLPKLQGQQLLPFIWLEVSQKAMGSLMLSTRARRSKQQH